MKAPSTYLGINTNCGNTIEDQTQLIRASRARRYALQSVAKDVLKQTPHPKSKDWRTVGCLSYAKSGDVSIRYTPEIQRASFVGACICGSVWVCPVCSARISELRRVELSAMHAVHAAAGGMAYMVTLTVPHMRTDALRDLLGKRRDNDHGLANAVHRFRQDRTAKKAINQLDRVGYVRATEITHGANGWHPHFHELWFVAKPARLHGLRDGLLTAWQRACGNSGLAVPNGKGVDIREAWDASAYLAKIGHEQTWGAARELVTAGTKKGRSGSRNAWQLLDAAGQGDTAARSAFSEFAQATLGQRQLVPSRGLRPAMGVEEKTDEQLAEHVDESSYLIATIDIDDWRRILALPGDVRALLLDLAEDEGPEGVANFIHMLRLDPYSALDYLGTAADPHAMRLAGYASQGETIHSRSTEGVLA